MKIYHIYVVTRKFYFFRNHWSGVLKAKDIYDVYKKMDKDFGDNYCIKNISIIK